MNLFQFILNIMEVMCLVHECMKCSVGRLKLTARIGSSSKINLNMQHNVGEAQHNVGEALQEQGHCGTLVPNCVH